MSEQKTTNRPPELQRSGTDLLKEFQITRVVDSPEFHEAIRFSREELQKLRESMRPLETEDQKIQMLRGFIETKKSGKKFEARAEVVQEVSQMRLDALKGKVDAGARTSKSLEAAAIQAKKKDAKFFDHPIDYAIEHPWKTAGYGVATVAAGYLGWKALGWIGGLFGSEGEKKDSAKEASTASSGAIDSVLKFFHLEKYSSILGPIAKTLGVTALLAVPFIALGGFDKVKQFAKWCAKKCGYESDDVKNARNATQKYLEGQKVSISSDTLAKISEMKVLDVVSGGGASAQLTQWSENWGLVGSVIRKGTAEISGVDLADLSEAERKEFVALRGQLLKEKEAGRLSKVGKDMTLENWYTHIGNPEEAKKLPANESMSSLAVVGAGAAVASAVASSGGKEKASGVALGSEIDGDEESTLMRLVAGLPATGKDRTLGARVSEYAVKTKYYSGLMRKYMEARGIRAQNIASGRISLIESLYHHESTMGAAYKGNLANMLEVEKRGGLQGLLVSLQSSKVPTEIEGIRKQIDLYLRESAQFERKFEQFVRNGKFSKSVFESINVDGRPEAIERFELLKKAEETAAQEVHKVAQGFEKDIESLRLRARNEKWSPQQLAQEEASIRKAFSEALHGAEGVVTRHRGVQQKMMVELRDIAHMHDLPAAQNYIAKLSQEKKISTKILGNGKLSIALISLTIGSTLLIGADSKQKLWYTAGEAVGAFVPGVNVALDARRIWTGRDMAGNSLAWWERYMLDPAFLVLDTAGSIVTFTGIGYVAQGGIGALKTAYLARGAAKAAKVAKEVAVAGHVAEGTIKEAGVLAKLAESGKVAIEGIKDIRKVPVDFVAKYKEGVQVAHSYGWLRTASPLVTASKLAVYGSLGWAVCTTVGEVGSFVVDKAKGVLGGSKEAKIESQSGDKAA